jgi:hypothetical protein
MSEIWNTSAIFAQLVIYSESFQFQAERILR